MSDLLTYLRQRSKDCTDRLDELALIMQRDSAGGYNCRFADHIAEVNAERAQLELIDSAMGFVHEWMETQR